MRWPRGWCLYRIGCDQRNQHADHRDERQEPSDAQQSDLLSAHTGMIRRSSIRSGSRQKRRVAAGNGHSRENWEDWVPTTSWESALLSSPFWVRRSSIRR